MRCDNGSELFSGGRSLRRCRGIGYARRMPRRVDAAASGGAPASVQFPRRASTCKSGRSGKTFSPDAGIRPWAAMSITARRWMKPCGARCARAGGDRVYARTGSGHVFRSEQERELVYVHRAVYDGPVVPSDELDGGRFWSRAEVLDNLGKGVFTPNFEGEAKLIFE